MTQAHEPLSAEVRARIEAVFEEALDLPPDRRSGWLAARCGADVTLRQEVEAMLSAFERPDGLLDNGAAPFAPLAAMLSPDLHGQQTIGPYRIIRELGRGGMGVVYLADRNDGHYQHRVAIKLLSGGHAAGELYRRFLAERQILASLSHPNIAQLLDGGITESGVPYLVIEYVDGSPITTYCQQQQTGIERRLELFRAACAAIHHAHANLVLHLDVKPANILVTRDGQVKLLDFGIAKLLAPFPASDGNPLTRTAARPMTPAYASPEQAWGGALSTASDVYALGLVLYELLSGSRPYDVEGQSLAQAASIIAEQEPPRPSTHESPFSRALRGDLDAIVMMALRKEPERRYGSADLFSEDIGRYLDGQPVLAHKGTSVYRLRKLVRRHRVAAGGILLGVGALLGGVGAAMWQARAARREQMRATSATAEAQEVTRFLVGMFGPGQLVANGARSQVSVEELVRDGEARAEALSDRPLVQARMFVALAQIHRNLGHLASADTFATRALRVWTAALGPNDARVADAMIGVAEIRRMTGAYRSADSLVGAATAVRRAQLGNTHPDVASALLLRSMLAVYLNDLDRSIALTQEAIAIRRATTGGDSALVEALHSLASTLWRKGRNDESIAAYREATALALRTFREPHAMRVSMQLRLAERLSLMPGQRSEAERVARAALAEARALSGEASPLTANALANVAGVLWLHGGRETELMFRQALEIQHRLAPGLADEAMTMLPFSEFLAGSHGSLDEAESMKRRALAMLTAQYGPNHSVVAGALLSLGDLLLQRGRFAEAESTYLAAIRTRTIALGAESYMVAYTSLGLARLATARGELARADSIYAASRAVLLRTVLPTQYDVREIDSLRAALRNPPFPSGVLPPLPTAQ